MRYFIIAGEASGDLHGSQLIKALKEHDKEAEFDFLGGDLMAAQVGHGPIIHYRDMAYMGFIEVVKHLKPILGFLKRVKQHIAQESPQAVILIDYPSFNLKVAKFAHKHGVPVFYFISPKVWVWKERRVKDIKLYVDSMFSILPFETAFYRKHDYEVQYVGNPTVNEIEEAKKSFSSFNDFCDSHGLTRKPIIAIVPGSRIKEITSNLPIMLEAALQHKDFQPVITAAPAIEPELYNGIIKATGKDVKVLSGVTFEVVNHARAALVTSGTATLETAILKTPQVACFRMNGSKLVYKLYKKLLKVEYVTLPNLVAGAPVIPELLVHNCTVENIDRHLRILLADDSPERKAQLEGYERIAQLLTSQDCTATTATAIIKRLKGE